MSTLARVPMNNEVSGKTTDKQSEAQGKHIVDTQSFHHSHSAWFNFAKLGIQPKLKVSQPGDFYEQEADRVAELVMRMSVNHSAVPITARKEHGIDRKCSDCGMEEEETKINRKPSSSSNLEETTDQIANEINNIRSSSGSTLDASTQEFMESRFGYDFGKVRIHADERAAKSSNSMNALAYTVGNDIIFGQGQYRQDTLEGKKLLAHELTHVVQQTGGSSGNSKPHEIPSLNAASSPRPVNVPRISTGGELRIATQRGYQPSPKPLPSVIGEGDSGMHLTYYYDGTLQDIENRYQTLDEARAILLWHQDKVVVEYLEIARRARMDLYREFPEAKKSEIEKFYEKAQKKYGEARSILRSFDEFDSKKLENVVSKFNDIMQLVRKIDPYIRDYRERMAEKKSYIHTISEIVKIVVVPLAAVVSGGSIMVIMVATAGTNLGTQYAEKRAGLRKGYDLWDTAFEAGGTGLAAALAPELRTKILDTLVKRMGVHRSLAETYIVKVIADYNANKLTTNTAAFLKAAADPHVDLKKFIKEMGKDFLEPDLMQAIMSAGSVAAEGSKPLAAETPRIAKGDFSKGYLVDKAAEGAGSTLNLGDGDVHGIAAYREGKTAEFEFCSRDCNIAIKKLRRVLEALPDETDPAIKEMLSLRIKDLVTAEKDLITGDITIEGANKVAAKAAKDLQKYVPKDPELGKLLQMPIEQIEAKVRSKKIEEFKRAGKIQKLPPGKGTKTVKKTRPEVTAAPKNEPVVPIGFEDIFEMVHTSERTTIGSRQVNPETEAGLFGHEHFSDLEDMFNKFNMDARKYVDKLPAGRLDWKFRIRAPGYDPGREPRPDLVCWDTAKVYEIKPNSKYWIMKGEAQLKQYVEWMNRYHQRPDGKLWKAGGIITYNQEVLLRWLRDIGYLPKTEK